MTKQQTGTAHDGVADVHALCVSRVPIFNHLPADQLAVIAGKASMRVYERGQFIHRSGEQSDQLFIIHKGQAKVYRLSDTGKEQLVRVLRSGDFIGELALFSEAQHDSYAEVTQTAQVCAINRQDVRNLLLQYPTISLHVLAEVTRRLGSSEKQAAVIATESINARIGQYLAELADREGSSSFHLPMSRKDLASYLGTTPETLSRRFTEFETAGWIEQSGQRRIKILDLDALLLV